MKLTRLLLMSVTAALVIGGAAMLFGLWCKNNDIPGAVAAIGGGSIGLLGNRILVRVIDRMSRR